MTAATDDNDCGDGDDDDDCNDDHQYDGDFDDEESCQGESSKVNITAIRMHMQNMQQHVSLPTTTMNVYKHC